ncbi:four-carbon acid sugar kinase family protein [Gallibacterium anatis]|uniref:four-carbon acid sugar kinase family protein n=1 Tax=Gallibacterium anatis TaxID=750 RepID=UPI0025516333|nr:four-carbon acid sugar kinase family protein [Gallibacterium anatis]WIM83634.1 four-carbon acid sugar kinase family protein [Gallibacterium anatis]WKS96917.1 four-carbon acid sugar kinase family protein [Gallibacterium anatis]
MDIVVIADDLTGANDTAVQFYKKGLTVDMVFALQQVNESNASDVLVINTDSRSLMIENAQKCIFAIGEHLNLEQKQIYKKVDSTLRGNIGAELEACLSVSDRNVAIFCPALPSANRIVKDGVCFVDGKPLLETEFATDPKTPVISSNVNKIIENQTNIPVVIVNMDLFSESEIIQQIKNRQFNKTIFSFDAKNDDDLKKISQIIKKIDFPIIASGSSGLAKYVFSKSLSDLPVLFVIGSMSKKINEQVELLRSEMVIDFISINAERLLVDQQYQLSLIKDMSLILLNKNNLIIKTEGSSEVRGKIDELCDKFSLTRVELGERIGDSLSSLVISLLNNIDKNISGLFLTGGDIAMKVIKELKLSNYHIAGEIESGVPYGYFSDNDFSGIPIITKAGAFGSKYVLKNSLVFIKNLTKEY